MCLVMDELSWNEWREFFKDGVPNVILYSLPKEEVSTKKVRGKEFLLRESMRNVLIANREATEDLFQPTNIWNRWN